MNRLLLQVIISISAMTFPAGAAPTDAPTVNNGSGPGTITATASELNGELVHAGSAEPDVYVCWGEADGIGVCWERLGDSLGNKADDEKSTRNDSYVTHNTSEDSDSKETGSISSRITLV